MSVYNMACKHISQITILQVNTTFSLLLPLAVNTYKYLIPLRLKQTRYTSCIVKNNTYLYCKCDPPLHHCIAHFKFLISESKDQKKRILTLG